MKSMVGRLWLTLVVSAAAICSLLGLFLSQLFDNFILISKRQPHRPRAKSGPTGAFIGQQCRAVVELALVENFLKANVVIMDKSGLISKLARMQHHRRLRGGARY